MGATRTSPRGGPFISALKTSQPFRRPNVHRKDRKTIGRIWCEFDAVSDRNWAALARAYHAIALDGVTTQHMLELVGPRAVIPEEERERTPGGPFCPITDQTQCLFGPRDNRAELVGVKAEFGWRVVHPWELSLGAQLTLFN